jgi:hypothetical protein
MTDIDAADTENWQSPIILQLPNELLQVILDHLVHSIYVDCINNGAHSKNFLRYTHICHRIRDLALASPRLWRFIDVSHQRLSQEFLIRSKSASISLIMESAGYGEWSNKLRLSTENLRPHINRIHSVHVDLDPMDMKKLLSVIQPITRQISTLRLRYNPMGYQAQFPYRLEYDFPSVRQLGLVQITARWESFSNLTRLYLRGGRHTLDITFRELRNIILRSPGLEYLSLTATVPVICDLPEHTIHLPHLQCLSLETNSDLISHLLQAIESYHRLRM